MIRITLKNRARHCMWIALASMLIAMQAEGPIALSGPAHAATPPPKPPPPMRNQFNAAAKPRNAPVPVVRPRSAPAGAKPAVPRVWQGSAQVRATTSPSPPRNSAIKAPSTKPPFNAAAANSMSAAFKRAAAGPVKARRTGYPGPQHNHPGPK